MSDEIRARGEGAQECVPNIGPLERRKRVRLGARLFAVAALLAGGLVVWGVGRAWRLSILPLCWAAAVGVFQAREKT